MHLIQKILQHVAPSNLEGFIKPLCQQVKDRHHKAMNLTRKFNDYPWMLFSYPKLIPMLQSLRLGRQSILIYPNHLITKLIFLIDFKKTVLPRTLYIFFLILFFYFRNVIKSYGIYRKPRPSPLLNKYDLYYTRFEL